MENCERKKQHLRVNESLQITDTQIEEDYDEITQLTSRICGTPISLISLIDEHRLWFKSKAGLDISETPSESSFCIHAIGDQTEILEISDAHKDKRFVNSPLVSRAPNIRFYAGMPLVTSQNEVLGTLCVMDKVPRKLNDHQRNALKMMAHQTVRLLETKKLAYRYERFFESTSDLIYELDAEGKYLYVNNTVKKVLGYSSEELRNKVCWGFVPERYRTDTIKYYFSKIRKREKSSYYEFPIRAKGGHFIWLGQSVDYEFDPSGKVTRAYAIAKDMTEIKAAYEEQDNLVAVIAHDLKTPFTQIHGLSDLIEYDADKETGKLTKLIKKVTIDSQKTIENLVYLKSFEKSGFSEDRVEIDLERFYKSKFEIFSSEAAEKNIVLKGSSTLMKKKFMSDENSLSRIVDNLLSNAIKFSPSESQVLFELKNSPDEIEITIEDQGPGFSEKDKKMLFRKFQKLSARPTGGESSSGLGLSIVKALVKGLNGTIDLDSDDGNGAKFIVRLPWESFG